MVNVFNNLKLLKQDMILANWNIDSFCFKYKKQNYIVLVKLFDLNEKKPKYALLKLEFLKSDDFNYNLCVYANSNDLLDPTTGASIDAKILRIFFGIEYRKNLGEIISQFKQHLATFIPDKVIRTKTKEQIKAMYESLNKTSSEDPNRKYCFAVKRNSLKNNGKSGERSQHNDIKTRLLRPNLHKRLESDKSLSFCYSTIPEDEKSDEDIISSWAKNKT